MSTFFISDCDGNHVKGKMLMLSGILRVESFVFKTDRFSLLFCFWIFC